MWGFIGIYEEMKIHPILQNCKIRRENVSQRNGRHFPFLLY